MPTAGNKRTPEAIAAFQKTMAAKRAIGWKPKRKAAKKKAGKRGIVSAAMATKGNAKLIRLKVKKSRKRRTKKLKATSIPLANIPERSTGNNSKRAYTRKAKGTLREELALELVRLVREVLA